MSPTAPRLRSLTLAAALGALLACAAGPAGAPDAGPAVTPDAGLPASELLGRCREDSQCPGEGAFCAKNVDGFPGGICTRTCQDRTDCIVNGAWNYCLPDDAGARRICVRKCLNGLDCSRPGYTCSDALEGGAGICYPVCSGDVCGDGAVCNTESGLCTAPGALPAGAHLGDGCAKAEDCVSGACTPETGGGAAIGFIGGLCTGPCILPAGWNNNTVFSGGTLLPGTCPAGNICVPDSSFDRGNPGTCLRECTNDAGCRPGFGCVTSFRLSDGTTKSFTNGFCSPLDCTREDCPSGYLCKLSGTRYVCAKDEAG
jgi:hypothetical protein